MSETIQRTYRTRRELDKAVAFNKPRGWTLISAEEIPDGRGRTAFYAATFGLAAGYVPPPTQSVALPNPTRPPYAHPIMPPQRSPFAAGFQGCLGVGVAILAVFVGIPIVVIAISGAFK